jgi:GMP synthase (glutamine-hydrolysing)
MAQLGRKDRAARLPDGLTNLASSERNPHQAFRVSGQPIWATQFHPELDARTNRARFLRYLDGYAMHMTPEERRVALERFEESPETALLLPGFLHLVFGEHRASSVVAIPQGDES